MKDLETLVRWRIEMSVELGSPSLAEIREGTRAYRRWLRAQLRRKLVVGFLSENAQGRPVSGAIVWLQEVTPRPGLRVKRIPRIHAMYTEPTFRRQGAGSGVVRAAIRWAREHGYPRISLRSSEQGRQLYRKMGFRDEPEMVRSFSRKA